MLAKEILQKKKAPITIYGDRLLEDAMRLLIENKIGCLIVTDEDECPIGIITEHDIFRLAYRYRGDMMDMNVGENMTRNLVVAAPDDSLDQLAVVMIEKRIRHLPIIEGDNRLCGVISIRDIIKAGINSGVA